MILENTADVRLIGAFGLFMALWGIFYLASWKRRNAVVRLEWGMDGFQGEERNRAEFESVPVAPPINGSHTRYLSCVKTQRRLAASFLFISILIVLVLGAVATIFVCRYFVQKGHSLHGNMTISTSAGPHEHGTYGRIDLSVVLASMLNASNIHISST